MSEDLHYKIFGELGERRKRHKQKFEQHDNDLCMLCHAYGADKRSFLISVFYDVNEAIPEALDITDVGLDHFKSGFYLRICKNCRGELLGKLREWRDQMVARRNTPKDHDGNDEYDDPEKLLLVRINGDGATVMMTEHQYAEYKRKQAEE